ncbi:MAG: ABC transporter ATP-binding protein [Acidobacteria bacterium]|nr:ABC transporter ATP-binding protein [Acidobacteriota bacterium]
MSDPRAAGVPILSVHEVRFRHHGAATALFEDLSLHVAPGEFLGVIGPNGSGKTTLLRLLAGVAGPAGGEVRLAGRPIRTIAPPERARQVAVVFQETRVLFNFSVLEIALMGRAPRLGRWGMERPEDFAAARAALAEMDLADQEDRHLHELSSGERQRALIARALAQEPRIVLMDEPTAFLDLKHRLQIYAILTRLNRDRGLTVVATSHDLNLAARYGSRLVLLHKGRVAADGPPASVLTAARIREVYETEARVERDAATGAPYVVPIAPVR